MVSISLNYYVYMMTIWNFWRRKEIKINSYDWISFTDINVMQTLIVCFGNSLLWIDLLRDDFLFKHFEYGMLIWCCLNFLQMPFQIPYSSNTIWNKPEKIIIYLYNSKSIYYFYYVIIQNSFWYIWYKT